MLNADFHHADCSQAKETRVDEVRWGSCLRQNLYGGLQYRIGHRRQIDQALDRTPIEDLPDRFVFGLDVLLGGMRRYVDAQPAQACEPSGYSVVGFRLQSMEPNLQIVDGSLVDFGRGA